MKQKIIIILLVLAILFIALLFQPNFHRPPFEIQDRVLRLVIEYAFYTSIGVVIICSYFLIKNKTYRVLYFVFGSLMLFVVLFGLFCTWINDGGTYLDTNYYKSAMNNKIVVKQYYDKGAFGSSTRYIMRKSIDDKIGWFKTVDKSILDSNWVEVSSEGKIMIEKY